ncbi:MAG: hypothetical protein CMP88_11540 [Gammaproteobacteria bacterium]|nr:hypothetical protein [Gammaproteobacteria bacterium]
MKCVVILVSPDCNDIFMKLQSKLHISAINCFSEIENDFVRNKFSNSDLFVDVYRETHFRTKNILGFTKQFVK